MSDIWGELERQLDHLHDLLQEMLAESDELALLAAEPQARSWTGRSAIVIINALAVIAATFHTVRKWVRGNARASRAILGLAGAIILGLVAVPALIESGGPSIAGPDEERVLEPYEGLAPEPPSGTTEQLPEPVGPAVVDPVALDPVAVSDHRWPDDDLMPRGDVGPLPSPTPSPPRPTASPSRTSEPTPTPSPTPSRPPTPSPTPTLRPTPTSSPPPSPSPTPTPSPTRSPSPSPTPTPTANACLELDLLVEVELCLS